MPLSIPTIFRGLLLLAMVGHEFYMYSFARTMGDRVGFGLSGTIASMLFALAMVVPLLWALGLMELPEIMSWMRRRRRWKAGRCSACGYPSRGAVGEACSECAAVFAEPESYRITVPSLRRFGGFVLIAWLLGSATAEVWTLRDERHFEGEVQRWVEAGEAGPYARTRRWPMGQMWLRYEGLDGAGERPGDDGRMR